MPVFNTLTERQTSAGFHMALGQRMDQAGPWGPQWPSDCHCEGLSCFPQHFNMSLVLLSLCIVVVIDRHTWMDEVFGSIWSLPAEKLERSATKDDQWDYEEGWKWCREQEQSCWPNVNAFLWFQEILSHNSGEAQRLFEEPNTFPERVAFLAMHK